MSASIAEGPGIEIPALTTPTRSQKVPNAHRKSASKVQEPNQGHDRPRPAASGHQSLANASTDAGKSEFRRPEDAQTPITKKKDRDRVQFAEDPGIETPSPPEDAQTPITKQKDRVRVKLAAKVATNSAGVETPSKLRHLGKIECLKTKSKLSEADHEAQKISTTPGRPNSPASHPGKRTTRS